MLRLGHKSIALAVVAVVWLYSSQATEAGMMVIGVGDDLAGSLSLESSGAGAVSDDEQPQQRTDDCSIAHPQFAFGALAIPADSSSSMGSGSGTGPSGGAQSALLGSHDCSVGQIVTYLSGEPGLHLPVLFLDGVFRPPRFVRG